MLVDQKMEKEIVKNQSDFVIFTEGYTQIHLIKSEDVEEHDSVFWLYKIGVPMLMFLTILSFALNGFILLAILLRTNFLSVRSSTRYLLLITSLVASDTITSVLLGGGIFCGSYLPIVFDIILPMCVMLAIECVRLSIVLTTVLHLLLMVLLHTAAVCFPLALKTVIRTSVVIHLILVMWSVPLAVLVTVFSSFPDQLFSSEYCADISLLQTRTFRAFFVAAIFTPLAIIITTYFLFYHLLSKRSKLSRSNRTIQRQNRRAARITLLILLSCIICWLPASITHLVICPEGCIYSSMDINPQNGFIIHASGNFMLILKSIINPLIFAMRHKEVHRDVLRLLRCKAKKKKTVSVLRNQQENNECRRILSHKL